MGVKWNLINSRPPYISHSHTRARAPWPDFLFIKDGGLVMMMMVLNVFVWVGERCGQGLVAGRIVLALE